MRMPTFFISHGGGPCFFMDWQPAHEWDALADYLRTLPSTLPQAPKALLVISAHWEEAVPTVTTAENPPLIFDYYGFPAHTYQLSWPASGSPTLAQHIQQLLSDAGIACNTDAQRGFDHGTFIPMLLSFPQADIPTVQLSIYQHLDPATHYALGKALAALRDQGVLIIGSGFSYHNMRGYNTQAAIETSAKFDDWLTKSVTLTDDAEREKQLTHWENAPEARSCHPRSEHLVPLFVAAGAAHDAQAKCDFKGQVLGVTTSCFRFG